MKVLDGRIPREKRGAEDLCFHYICYIPAQRQVLTSLSDEHNPSTAPTPQKVLAVIEICGDKER